MSKLLAMHLLRKNPYFQDRIQSALVNLAREQHDAEGSNGAYARMILADPTRVWPDFIINAAAHPYIQDAAVVSEDASFVVTTNVTDQHITESVTATYWEAAAKYAPQPAEGEEQ